MVLNNALKIYLVIIKKIKNTKISKLLLMIPKINRTMMHFENGVFMVDYNNKVGNLYNSPPPHSFGV